MMARHLTKGFFIVFVIEALLKRDPVCQEGGGRLMQDFLQKILIWAMPRLIPKFHPSTLPRNGQKVCGGVAPF